MIDHATQAHLAAVRMRFANQMPAHVAQMRADWLALTAVDPVPAEGVEQMLHSVQRLEESAVTFAYAELGDAARALEVALRQGVSPARRAEVELLISKLWP